MEHKKLSIRRRRITLLGAAMPSSLSLWRLGRLLARVRSRCPETGPSPCPFRSLAAKWRMNLPRARPMAARRRRRARPFFFLHLSLGHLLHLTTKTRRFGGADERRRSPGPLAGGACNRGWAHPRQAAQSGGAFAGGRAVTTQQPVSCRLWRRCAPLPVIFLTDDPKSPCRQEILPLFITVRVRVRCSRRSRVFSFFSTD
jgi:hypothetical protein